MKFKFNDIFPHEIPREAQVEGIDFILNTFLNSNKKFAILEAGTGVGKSAVGVTIARYLNDNTTEDILLASNEFGNGSYFVTTQKILQDQYVNDFGNNHGPMKSIKSSSNYRCRYHKSNSCAESNQQLRTADKQSNFFKTCVFNCTYKNAKKEFLDSSEGITNFPYLLTEAAYSGKLTPRKFLVIDEAHNIELELSKFIEINVTERFSKQMLKLTMPQINTQAQAMTWIKETYYPKLKSLKKHIESMLGRYTNLREKLNEFTSMARQLDLIVSHESKIERFLKLYTKDNWVFEVRPPEGKKGRRFEFKPIDIAPYADSLLFRLGGKILMMSATILNKEGFCQTLGLSSDQVDFLSIPSPFPIENRPIMAFPVGKMSAAQIDQTLPRLKQAVEEILKNHKNEKGIIHCHTFKIANFLKRNIKSSRLLIHNSENREQVLRKHINSKKPTVILSPSMAEGVDLKNDTSRFQIICKVPFPYLGDKLVRKRMNKWKWWYPLQTAKKIVQSAGRSVRNSEDHAITYILDSDWGYFFSRNKEFFPDDFKDVIR